MLNLFTREEEIMEAQPYTDEELELRAALATKDGDTRDAASFFALTVNRGLINAACQSLRAAAKHAPQDIGDPLRCLADDMEANKA